jgi:hypothetical protein
MKGWSGVVAWGTATFMHKPAAALVRKRRGRSTRVPLACAVALATLGASACEGGGAEVPDGGLYTGGSGGQGNTTTSGGMGPSGGRLISGGTQAGGGPAGGGSSSGASGGTRHDAGGSAGANAQGGMGGDAPVPTGRCTIEHEWRVPHDLRSPSVFAFDDGLAVTSEASTSPSYLDWTLIRTGTAAMQTVSLDVDYTDPNNFADSILGAIVLGTREKPRFLIVHSTPLVGTAGESSISVFDELGHLIREELDVMPVVLTRFRRVTTFSSPRLGIAGFANSDVTVGEPRLVLVDAEGRPLTEPVRLLDGDSALVDSLSFTETREGFLASFINSETGKLELTEFDVQGAQASYAAWPVPTGFVSNGTWYETSGTYFQFVARDEQGADLSREIYTYEQGTLAHITSLPMNMSRIRGASGRLVRVTGNEADQVHLIEGGESRPLPIPDLYRGQGLGAAPFMLSNEALLFAADVRVDGASAPTVFVMQVGCDVLASGQ